VRDIKKDDEVGYFEHFLRLNSNRTYIYVLLIFIIIFFSLGGTHGSDDS